MQGKHLNPLYLSSTSLYIFSVSTKRLNFLALKSTLNHRHRIFDYKETWLRQKFLLWGQSDSTVGRTTDLQRPYLGSIPGILCDPQKYRQE